MNARGGGQAHCAGSAGRGVLLLAACLAVSAAVAGTLPVPMPGPRLAPSTARPAAVNAWDCWMDGTESGGIRCIADRDIPAPPAGDETDDDEAAEALLELVHDNLHRGQPLRAGELVREMAFLLRREDLWTIRLSAPPYESSWSESRPQALVRALLCRGRPDCAIRFHR